MTYILSGGLIVFVDALGKDFDAVHKTDYSETWIILSAINVPGMMNEDVLSPCSAGEWLEISDSKGLR